MREKTVEKIIKDFIAKELMMDAGDIKRETNLVNDLNPKAILFNTFIKLLLPST